MIRQPSRVIVGHCPSCRRILVVENEHEVWPWIVCKCEWSGDTEAIADRARYDRGYWARDQEDAERRAAEDEAGEREMEREAAERHQ